MVVNLRTAGMACGVMFASAAVALSTASPSLGASAALVFGGTSHSSPDTESSDSPNSTE